MSVTTRFVNSSKRNVRRFGRDVTYSVVSEGAFDVNTGSMGSSSITPHTVKAFKTTNSNEDINSPNLIGKEVHTFLIAGGDIDFTPETDDTISYSYNTETFTGIVRRVQEYWAAEEVALYRIVCVSQ